MNRRAHLRRLAKYHRMARKLSPTGVANALLLASIIVVEVMRLIGIPFGALSPIVMLGIAAGVYIAGARLATPAIAAGGSYSMLRMAAEGDGLGTAAGSVLLVTVIVVLTPGLISNMRRWTERSHRRERTRDDAATRQDLQRLDEERRNALDGLEALVWESDPATGRMRFLNAFATTMLGYTVDEKGAGAEYSRSLIHPEDQPKVRSTMEAVMRDGRPRHVEYRIFAKDGFSVWVRDSISRVRRSEDPQPRLRGMAVDISARKAMEEDLHREKERYRALYEGVPVGLYRMTPQGEFLVANSALVNMMGFSSHQALYASTADAMYVDPLERWRWQNAMVHVQGVRSFELPCRRTDGSLIWVRNTAKAIRNDSGEIAYYEGALEDITDSKRARAAEATAEAKFRGLVEQSLVGIYMLQEGRLVYANPKMAEIFGYTHQELMELESPMALVIPEHHSKVARYFSEEGRPEDAGSISFRGIRKDGSLVEIEVQCTRATVNEKPTILGTLLDITARKEAEERLVHTAFHDPLTGLPNRILFMERLEHALMRRKRGNNFAVLFLDLNRFKVVNDSLGHSAGDELLKIVGGRLQSCLRPGDSVSRFGGDEFALLLEDVESINTATSVAERIREVLSLPAELQGQEVYTGVSIGIALSSAEYQTPEEILRDADMAMYRAKSSGLSTYEVFDQAMHAEAVERLRLENDLQRAADRDEFHLQYQPIVCLKTGELHGVEALVRWSHPERGQVGPSVFIPLAEEVGAIIPIGRHVLRLACRQAAEWQARFPREVPISISVNLSAKQIQGSPIVDDVRQVLEETGIAPGSLKLEITESLIMEDRRAASHMLSRLKALGVKILLDDFGTGYSSLSYLHTLPIDTLKIDRAFVMEVQTEERSSHLVRTIVSVAHNLGMDVIAEGAETEEQVQVLRELGCEHAQGFYFAAPREAHEIDEMLEAGAIALPGGRPKRLKLMRKAAGN